MPTLANWLSYKESGERGDDKWVTNFPSKEGDQILRYVDDEGNSNEDDDDDGNECGDGDEDNGDYDDMTWQEEWSGGNGFIGHTFSPASSPRLILKIMILSQY